MPPIVPQIRAATLQSHFFHMKALLTLTAAHLGRSELRSDLPSALAALGAEELRLDVRQPHVVGPAVSIDLDVVAATMVAAVDQHVAGAGFAHLAEGDLLRVGRHGFRDDPSTPNIRGADAGARFAVTPTCAFVRSSVGCRGDACDLPDDVAAVARVVVGTRWPADAQSTRRA